MNKKIFFTTIISGIIFLSSLILFNITPINVEREYNLTTTSIDGNTIAFDIFEPKNDDSSDKKAIIMGHGFIVNKEFLRLIALDLAENGFVVITFDFRSHGGSTGELSFEEPLKNDIIAIKQWLIDERTDIDMNNLGYLGYSMGGGAGFDLLYEDTDFKSMVGLAPQPQYNKINSSRPANLLVIAGKYDEAFDYEALSKIMENKTGISADKIIPNTLYGSFESNNASKLYIDSNSDHLTAPYDRDFVREIRGWFLQSLKQETSPSTNLTTYYMEMGIIITCILSGLMFFLSISSIILKTTEKWTKNDEKEIEIKIRKDEIEIEKDKLDKSEGEKKIKDMNINIKRSLKEFYKWELILVFPCFVFGIFIFVFPLTIAGALLAVFMAPSIVILFYYRYVFKTKESRFRTYYINKIKNTNLKSITIAFLLAILFYLILKYSLGQIFGIAPSISKWIWMPFYFIPLVFTIFNLSLYFQKEFSDRIGKSSLVDQIKSIMIESLLLISILSFEILVPCIIANNYFMAMVIIVAIPLIIVVITVTNVISAYTNDLLIPTIVNAFTLSIIFVTLSPIMPIIGSGLGFMF